MIDHNIEPVGDSHQALILDARVIHHFMSRMIDIPGSRHPDYRLHYLFVDLVCYFLPLETCKTHAIFSSAPQSGK